MHKRDYLDFDLEIKHATQGYRVEVDGPAGQSTATFTLPFSDLELENFLLKIGYVRRGMRRIDSPEVAALKTFGAQLFEAVFVDELPACLRSSIEEAADQGAGLRIRLRLNDTPELGARSDHGAAADGGTGRYLSGPGWRSTRRCADAAPGGCRATRAGLELAIKVVSIADTPAPSRRDRTIIAITIASLPPTFSSPNAYDRPTTGGTNARSSSDSGRRKSKSQP